jgi:hypothetical protein
MVTSLNQKSALLIQGPILSKGKTGRHFGKGNLPIDDNYFDATETINGNIRKFAEDFDLVVVATWNTEDTTGILGGDSVKILRSEVPKRKSKNKREPNGAAGKGGRKNDAGVQISIREEGDEGRGTEHRHVHE